MLHSFFRTYAIVFVVSKHLVEEVEGLFGDHVLVAIAYKVRPCLLFKFLTLHELFDILWNF